MTIIYNDYNIKKHSTFKIGGNVKTVAFPETIEELINLLSSEEYDYILGNCSNILFSSDKSCKKV